MLLTAAFPRVESVVTRDQPVSLPALALHCLLQIIALALPHPINFGLFFFTIRVPPFQQGNQILLKNTVSGGIRTRQLLPSLSVVVQVDISANASALPPHLKQDALVPHVIGVSHCRVHANICCHTRQHQVLDTSRSQHLIQHK